MWHLLKIEWFKIRKYRAFLLLLAFFVVSLFGLNYIVATVAQVNGPAPGLAKQFIGEPFAFPAVWPTVSYFSSFLLFIPGLLMILLMGNEFSYRTHRQNIIDGLSRAQFMWAKVALMGVLGGAVTLLVFLTGCLLGGGSFSLVNIRYIGYFFIQSIAYMSVALAIVLLFRRSGISIGLYFLYAFIVENLLAVLINRNIVSGGGSYLPLESADKLIPAPSILRAVIDSGSADPAQHLIVSLLWIAILLWFCHFRFRKMDL